MSKSIADVRSLLHEAAETHHQVYRITDGADDDWASWHADWLIKLSELPDLLTRRPVRSELTYQLVALDKEYSAAGAAVGAFLCRATDRGVCCVVRLAT
jgi:hypothetical protein